MSYKQSIDNCLGAGRLSEAQLAAALEQARGGLAQLRAWHGDDSLPLLALPGRRDDLAALRPVIGRCREGFDDVLVLGTGGSSLGGRALCALAPPGEGPRIHFLENTDPWSFSAAFEGLNLLRRHQKVNTILAEELKDKIHALSMETLTAAEWAARGGAVMASPECRGGGKRG